MYLFRLFNLKKADRDKKRDHSVFEYFQLNYFQEMSVDLNETSQHRYGNIFK